MTTAQPFIELRDLTVHDRHPAVHHLSGRFAPGSLTAVAGPNGAGKTTLLAHRRPVHPAHEGGIDRDGLAPDRSRCCRRPAARPQFSGLGASRGAGPWARMGRVRPPARRRRRGAAPTALHEVGLAGFERRLVGTLSAGQFQRVLFARLTVQDSPGAAARRAVYRHRYPNHRRPDAPDRPLARRGRTVIAVCTTSTWWPRFPRNAAVGTRSRWPGGRPRGRLAGESDLRARA